MSTNNPSNIPFDDLPHIIKRRQQWENEKDALTLQLRAQLKTRGRDMPTYPDDEDLIKSYEECQLKILFWYFHDMRDFARDWIYTLK